MRLVALDFLRGLALTVVMLDHVEWRVGSSGFFSNWTLLAIGFSDAAEAFVFLSGFSFGWGYDRRLSRHGFFECQIRVLLRTLQIYASYLASVLSVTLLEVIRRHASESTVSLVSTAGANSLQKTFIDALCLMHQPPALGILCTYVIVFPFLPAMLVLSRWSWRTMFALSLGLYAVVQFEPKLNLPTGSSDTWHFNPFAWQLLVVVGMTFGQRARNRQSMIPQSCVWTVAAIIVVSYALLVRKGELLLSDELHQFHSRTIFASVWSPLFSKDRLGPLRLIHFLALSRLVSVVLPKGDLVWKRPLATPFVLCGRHSLPVYCAGTVMAYLAVFPLRCLGTTPLTVAIVGVDACLLQFAFAAFLDRSGAKSQAESVEPCGDGSIEGPGVIRLTTIDELTKRPSRR
jgi:hypothetical protein